MSTKPKCKKVSEPLCTLYGCSVKEHGDQICKAIQMEGSTDDLSISYMKQLCASFSSVLDSDGRSGLHNAAVVGKNKVVQYLLAFGAKINHQENILQCTPLHFAVMSGNIDTAMILLKYGADPKIEDKHGFTPIHYIINQQPLKCIPRNSKPLLQGYSWGINANYNLGSVNFHARDYPEHFELPLRKGSCIASVSMNKFHTVFLSDHGKVFTCGHGRGGRLGLETDLSVIIPQVVKVSKHPVICIAAGVDHTVFLNSRNEVFACGENKYHQLGIYPLPSSVSSPQFLSHWHSKNTNVKVIGVAASDYHTAFWSNSEIFTCGLNAGQLGHSDRHNEAFVDLPKCPSFMKNLDKSRIGDIQEVAASEGATVFFTSKRYVYACYEYKTHHIPFNIGSITKIACCGGIVDANLGVELFPKYKKQEMKIAALTSKREVFVWCSSQSRQRGAWLWHISDIFDFCFSIRELCLVTMNREVFFGYLVDTDGVETPSDKSKVATRSYAKCFNSLKNIQRGKNITNLYRTHSVFCDPNGENFIALQYEPSLFLKRKVDLPVNSVREDISHYYCNMSDSCCNCDVEILCGDRRFPAHSYILSYNSEYLYHKILEDMETWERSDKDNSLVESKIELKLDGIQPDVVQELLTFMYTRHMKKLDDPKRFIPFSTKKEETFWKDESIIHLERQSPHSIMESVKKRKRSKESSVKCKGNKKENINYNLKLVKEGSCTLKMETLQDLLLQINQIDEKTSSIDFNSPAPLPDIPEQKYDREKFEFADVTFRCKDGELIKAHKCILMARSSYFEAMLGLRWNQFRETDVVDVCLTSQMLRPLLDFLYTNESPDVSNSKNLDFLCDVLSTSHLYMVEGLHLLCQRALSQALTLKNALDMLKFCLAYDLDSLKEVILEFICLNMPYYFETRSLKNLDKDLLTLIKSTYEETVRPLNYQQHIKEDPEDLIVYSSEDEEPFHYVKVNDQWLIAEDLSDDSCIDYDTEDDLDSNEEFHYKPLETVESSILLTNIKATCLPSLEDLGSALKGNPDIVHQSPDDWFQDERSKRLLQNLETKTDSGVERKRKSHKKRTRKISSSSCASTSSNSESDAPFELEPNTELFSFEDLEDRIPPQNDKLVEEEEWKVVGKFKVSSTPPVDVSSVEIGVQSLKIENDDSQISRVNRSSNITIVKSKLDFEGNEKKNETSEFASSLDNSPFPSLSEALAIGTCTKTPSAQNKRMPKFQSKSGKKSKKSRNNSTEQADVSSPCAWGGLPITQGPSPAMSEIIKTESSSSVRSTPKMVEINPDRNITSSSINTSKEIVSSSPTRQKERPLSDDCAHWNPVTNSVIESPKGNFSRSFSSIMEEEVSYTRQMEREKNKPLSIIQLEERAIKELLEFYGGPFNPEERVTVKRYVTNETKPSWNIQYRHV